MASGQTDGQTHGQTDRQTHGQTDRGSGFSSLKLKIETFSGIM